MKAYACIHCRTLIGATSWHWLTPAGPLCSRCAPALPDTATAVAFTRAEYRRLATATPATRYGSAWWGAA